MKKSIYIILISLFMLTGCNKTIESFSQNTSIYNNKEQADAQLFELKEEMIKNNEKTDRYFKMVNEDLKLAKSMEQDFLVFLKDTNALTFNIESIRKSSLFYYNILVYKTQLLYDIENAVNEEMNKSTALSKEEIEKEVTEDILSTLKIDYFMGEDKLEQSVSYKLRDGFYKVFSIEWINSCDNTNVFNYKEIVNEEII